MKSWKEDYKQKNFYNILSFLKREKMKSLEEISRNSVLNGNQLKKIEEIILNRGQYTQTAVREEISWFCSELGINQYYFKTIPLETIANHIEAIKAAEIMGSIEKEKVLKIDMGTELENEIIYLVDDSHYRALEVERRIEDKYPNYRIQSYRTLGRALGVKHLRIYLIYKPKFNVNKIVFEDNLKKIADKSFLKTAPEETRRRYQSVIKRSKGWETPLIEATHKEETNELRIMVVTFRDLSSRFFSNVSDVINSHNLVSHRKYIEQFANGKTVYAFYLDDILDEKSVQDLVEDISLVYVIPKSPLSTLFRESKLNAKETIFGVAAWSFAHQFLSGYNEEYLRLADVLKGSPELVGILRNMKTRLVKDTYDEASVWDALVSNYEYLKKLFKLFDKKFNPYSKDHGIEKEAIELKEEILRKIPVDVDREVFLSIIIFIQVILRTNFYKKEKNSLAFMYDPKFLNRVEYPVIPFGIFHIIAIEFRGFHIRFRNIARGGIRIVFSNNYQNYLNNSDFIFDENYNLAFTQQKKNKDIPEGGSKGTILLGFEYQDKAETAFKKYINGLLDLMLPDGSIVDYYGQELILFLGPDEGTAGLMEEAAFRAKKLGYPYWRAFSTGKPVEIGGIPHDLYGMTTNSVHQYVLNILEKLGLEEKNMKKVMTGGPDGDLGSNEILISKDKILAIIDGSGVLYDPEGIDRKELVKLAKKRRMVENFNKNLLSSEGFLITIRDQNITLPDGKEVINGLEFRNSFHIDRRFKAELFVPCGGRPNSININNWVEFLDEKGRPRFNYIVEGANLFISQEARLRLEEKGVIIYKDASANKGGVTSSSLEVFASLALTDEEYNELMCVRSREVPVFRTLYIEEILDIIRENASLEFELIWKENEKTGKPRAVISDLVSEKINNITDAIYASELFNDEKLFRKIIKCCCPKILVEKVGFAAVLERVPDSYLKSIFASRLASRYVYRYGLGADEIDFLNFINKQK